jgi:RimJ/RimL family protein N-acetyltransferase
VASIDPQARILKSGRGIIIRCAQPSDAAPLANLLQEVAGELAYTVAERDELPSPEELRLRIEDRARHPGRVMLVAATEGGELIGELDAGCGQRRRIAHRLRFGLSVAHPWRGMGVGRALIERLLDWATLHPTVEKVVLGVFAENRAAIALYEKLGFSIEGRRIREFRIAPGVYADDLIMARHVKDFSCASAGLAPTGRRFADR